VRKKKKYELDARRKLIVSVGERQKRKGDGSLTFPAENVVRTPILGRNSANSGMQDNKHEDQKVKLITCVTVYFFWRKYTGLIFDGLYCWVTKTLDVPDLIVIPCQNIIVSTASGRDDLDRRTFPPAELSFSSLEPAHHHVAIARSQHAIVECNEARPLARQGKN